MVVDLKTGRTKPTGPQVRGNLQLGLYQLAVDHGAVDGLEGLPPGHAHAGGAELVQLGLTDDGLRRQGAGPAGAGRRRPGARGAATPAGLDGGTVRRRGVPGRRRRPLPRLRLRAALPGQERRSGGGQ